LACQGRYADAEALFKRVLSLLGKKDASRGEVLNELGRVYNDQGRFDEAEASFQEAIPILEAAHGPDHLIVANPIGNLANLYWSAGRYTEAEPLYRRAQAIQEAWGASTPEFAITLRNLANLYFRLGRYAEAEPIAWKALAMQEKTLGPDHPAVATSLRTIAVIERNLGRTEDGLPLLRRSLAILEKTFGPDHPEVAAGRNALANSLIVLGRYDEAEPLARSALAIREAALPPDHLDLASVLKTLAQIHAATGHLTDAVVDSHRAAQIVIERLSRAVPGKLGIELSAVREYLHLHLGMLHRAAEGAAAPTQVFPEAFEVAQWANQSAAAAALSQVGVRFASGTGRLAGLIREQQDAMARYEALSKRLLAEISKGRRDPAVVNGLRKEIASLEAKLQQNSARVAAEFPALAGLTTPRPLGADQVRKLIGTHESLVFWIVADKETHVFAINREVSEWRVLPLGATALAERVARFRTGLDVDDYYRTPSQRFDLAFAHELFTELLEPVRHVFKDRRRLIVVPSGPLTALPVHLLVTEQPSETVPQDVRRYQDAAWLVKQHAITVLPSVKSLQVLRVLGKRAAGAKPMVGFGDPVFEVPGPNSTRAGPAPRRSREAQDQVAERAKVGDYASFWRGAGLDREKLANSLPPLPETADELKAVAANVGAGATDLYLGARATVTAVKQAPLSVYRTIYFATHGLVAGDVRGVGEPALALSLPAQPSAFDDGLLTASEVAQLQLDADWVVLSACNTAAGDRPGAEALSGLARAFFYAGARSLLVSHWAVASDAAVKLTSATFAHLRSAPEISRAEALRRAMLEFMTDPSSPTNAYPAFWGPFAIIGGEAAD